MGKIEDHDYNSGITYVVEEKMLENKELSSEYFNFIKNKISSETELKILQVDINRLDEIDKGTEEYKKMFDLLNSKIHSLLEKTKNESFLRSLVLLNLEYGDKEDKERVLSELKEYYDKYGVGKNLVIKEMIPNTVYEIISGKTEEINMIFVELFKKEVINWIQQKLSDKDFYKDKRDKIKELLKKLQK